MATKQLETVTIVSFDTNARGWFEVTTEEYDEPLVTKDAKVIKQVEALGIGPANVDVNVKPNGDFINRYLNGAEATNGEVLAAPAPSAEVQAVTESKRNEREATQLRIEAQWAFGRAIELHIAQGGSLNDLLDSDKFSALQAAAEMLRLGSRALADKG